MFILENESFNIHFILVGVGAVLLGTIMVFVRAYLDERKVIKDQEKLRHDENVLNDEDSILQKK